MKPYAFRSLAHEKKIFNYRLSRARRIVENAFGIFANRFRVFLSPMLLSPEHLPSEYTPPGTFDVENIETGSVKHGDWRSQVEEGMRSIGPTGSNNYKKDARIIRDEFCKYFNTVGAVSWQERFVQIIPYHG